MTVHRTFPWLLLVAACAAPSAPGPLATSGALVVQELGGVRFPAASAEQVALTDGLCFVACGEAGVRIVDVTDPTAPETLATIEDLRADAIAFAEDELWVVGVEDGLFGDRATLTVIDIVDPRVPGVRRDVSIPVDGAAAVSTEGGVGTLAAGAAGALVISGRALAVEDLSAELAAESADAALVRRGVRFFLGRSPDEEAVLVRTATGATARVAWTSEARSAGADLALSGDVLLVTTGSELRLVDVADLAQPAMLGALPLDGAAAVATSGAIGAVARGDVVLLDLDQPDRPTPAATITTSDGARDVALLDGLLAVADGAAGLRLYFVARADE